MISTILMLVFWLGCMIMAVLHNGSELKNKELQQENSDLIERNLKLDKLNNQLSKDTLLDINRIIKLEKRLKEATDLLTMQDKLIQK